MSRTLALSTSYFTLREPELSGGAIAQQVRSLNFTALELDYRVSEDQLQSLRPLLARGEIEAVSLHHPFPRNPEMDPSRAHVGGPWLTSLDREERRAAIRRATDSLAYAADLGAGVLVLHLGKVVLPAHVDSRELERWIREDKHENPEVRDLREELIATRRERSQAHLEATLSSLDRLSSEAVKRSVRLGLENRYHVEEIPDRKELESIFRELEGAPLGYWHDTGHAASLVAQGFQTSQTELLEAVGDRAIGFHLHDARGLEDHMAPGEGELDFSSLTRFVGDETILVLEVHPKSTPEALTRARDVLAEAGFRLGASSEAVQPEPG